MNVPTGLMAFWADFEEADIDALRRWHNCEHMLERVSIPGFAVGRRYRGLGEAQTFLMYYETKDAGVLASDAYQAALNSPTPWTKEALTLFRNPARNIYRMSHTSGSNPSRPAPFLATIRFNHAETEEAVEATYRNEILPGLAAMDAVRRARLYVIDDAISGIMTSERRIYGGGPGEQRYLLFVELADECKPFDPGNFPNTGGGFADGHSDVFSEIGWLDFWLDSPT